MKKPGLYANIHARRAAGKPAMNKPGSKNAPTAAAMRASQSPKKPKKRGA